MTSGGNVVPSITNAEHIGPNDTGDNIEAKRVANYRWNANTSEWERDDGSITLDASDIEIGAVEIKDGASDTRATVTSDGLEVDTGFQKDLFGHIITTQPYNQIELRLDASDWADYVTETNANGGDTTQSGGMASIATSTAATGSAILSSADTLEYRPGVGLFGAGTAIFTTGVAGANQYVGIGSDTSFTDGVQFGYKGTSFGIRYMRGGAEISFTAQASWDDPCLGAATSQFTRGGTAEILDPTKDNLYKIRAGLFGFAGWDAQVWSPDNGWITVLTYKHINTGTVPVFTSNTFKVVLSAIKTSGATNIIIKSQCWAAGTGSNLNRIGNTMTDRRLAIDTHSVITGHTTAGGGGYVDVKVNPSGALTADVTGTVTANLSATDNAVLDDIALNQTDGTQKTQIVDAGGEAATVTGGKLDVNAAFSAATYATRIDEASATVTYIGKADPGTASSAASWQIQKVDTTSGTVITFADGNSNFDNIYDNRASLTYS